MQTGARAQRPAASRRAALRVMAKVHHAEGSPRTVRGKAFVTKDVSHRPKALAWSLANSHQAG